MQTVLLVAGAVGLSIGSLVAATVLCWLLWDLFRFVRHPEWAALGVLLLVVLGMMGELPRSMFLGMALAFSAVAAVPLWCAGRKWRNRRRGGHVFATQARAPGAKTVRRGPRSQATSAPQPYPALAACIYEDRSPTRDETRIMAARLWRDVFAPRFGAQFALASFGARRALLRMVIASMRGMNAKKRA